MKKLFDYIRRVLNCYIPISPPILTKEQKEKRESEIIGRINTRIMMKDRC